MSKVETGAIESLKVIIAAAELYAASRGDRIRSEIIFNAAAEVRKQLSALTASKGEGWVSVHASKSRVVW